MFFAVKSSIIDKEPVSRVVNILVEAEAVDEENLDMVLDNRSSALRVIDAFDVPKYHYDSIKKIFYKYYSGLPFSFILSFHYYLEFLFS